MHINWNSRNVNTKGFEIALNTRRKVLQIRVWGEWDAEFGKRYEMALRDKFIELSHHDAWEIQYVLVDMTGLSMHTNEALSMLEEHVMSLNGGKIKKIAYVGNTRQLNQKNDRPGQPFFTSRAEAMHWFLE